jgi:hypothetical protein
VASDRPGRDGRVFKDAAATEIWSARGVDLPNDLRQVDPSESEEADRWDPAVEFFSGLQHF